ncbi:MAG: hypothetical protein D6743_04425 [Calditrichaeota bacterium]|nr:MAG: hypothetical protein D6743_04425 [Calditrichota bacterium]
MARVLMKSMICLAAFPILLCAQETTNAQETGVASLKGRHSVAASVGLMVEANSSQVVSVDGIRSGQRATAPLGMLSYIHWFQRDWAVTLSGGLLSAEATSSVNGPNVSSETGSVIPILFGIRYQPAALALSPAVRPYFSGSVGPYLGVGTRSGTGTVTGSETISETAVGARVAAGMDWLFGRFTFGMNAGYHFVTDFKQRIGSKKNYSGAELSLTFGILLGKGTAK